MITNLFIKPAHKKALIPVTELQFSPALPQKSDIGLTYEANDVSAPKSILSNSYISLSFYS